MMMYEYLMNIKLSTVLHILMYRSKILQASVKERIYTLNIMNRTFIFFHHTIKIHFYIAPILHLSVKSPYGVNIINFV
jgi:hypothetical protein